MENGAVKSGRQGGDMEAVPVPVPAPACIINKRRRRERDPSLGIAFNDINQQVGQQADQAAAAATTVKRSSKYRGVSRHRWTGRYEAHLWDKGSWNSKQRKKGKQVYLGAYDEEESAARAYDLAALKYWGTSTFTNFPVSEYEKEIEIMKTETREEYLAILRRRSSGFSRGVSKYRGVARHHHSGRWEARIGRIFGNKYLYLGTYGTQEEAAHAYDIAAIEYRGMNAITNFDLSTYIRRLKPEAEDNSHNPAFQEPKPILEYWPPTSSILSNHILTEGHQITDASIFNDCNPFPRQDWDIPNKQDSFQANIKSSLPFSPSTKWSSSSSPTALSLLLRSSVFKDLVEKNPNNIAKVNTEENDEKNSPKIGSKNDVEETLYDEIVINNPVRYICPSSEVYFMAESKYYPQ